MKQIVNSVDTPAGAGLQEVCYNPGNLRMFFYAPGDLPVGAPLIVLLHGCGQSAEAFAAGAGWLELADQHGFALLCPEQRRANNFNTCFNWFLPEDACRGSGEAASIAQMTRHVVESQALDSRRVFIAGLSAGGAMTNVMLAAYPELYAAGATIAGLPYAAARSTHEALVAMRRGVVRAPATLADAVRNASANKGPWPRLSVWHGDLDSTVAPANAGAIIRQWADVHRVSAAPPSIEQFGPLQRTRWLDGSGGVVLELNVIAGLNHAWALAAGGRDGCGAPGPFLAEAGVSTSAEILRFWDIHTEHRAMQLRNDIVQVRTPHLGERRSRAATSQGLPMTARLALPPARGPSGSSKASAAAGPKLGLMGSLRRLVARVFGARDGRK